MRVHIDNKENIKIKNEIEKYIKPQIIYIPLENKNGVMYKHLVKEGDYVYKGQVVAIDKKTNFPLHSSVSGNVITGTMKIISNGKKIKCIVIENDFKEKYETKLGSKRNIANYTKEEFLSMLKTHGITGLGGSDLPTYLKYSTDAKINYLVINGVECESYISCDKAIMRNYAEDILEVVDAILEIMNIKKAYIAVKINDFKTINAFSKYIGTYPNIKIYGISDSYPSGWQKNVIKDIFNIEYDKHASDIGIIENNVSTIYAIFEMLKYNRPLTERVITITGSGIKKPVNAKVKIGASIKEVINHIGGYKKIKNPLFIAGGPMMGKSMPTDDIVVTKDLEGIIVTNERDDKVLPCIKCGKCSEVCPVNLIPVAIMDNYNNDKKLKDLKPDRCISCGLCSYICPSKINLRPLVESLKGKVDNNGV